jgi:murein L,D-transpeptidase YcbB/YkuD
MGFTTARRTLFLTALLLAAVPSAAAEPPAAEASPGEAPAVAAGLELVVNVPAGELAVYENDRLVRIYPVSVGTWRHPTPIGEFTLTRATWNPWWQPPASDWARGEKAQPPGSRNAMGRVKLHFLPLYFIHGTTETAELGRPASHGCVRMANQDVVELARLVHRHATPDLAAATLDRLAANPRATREIPLARPVTLRIVYDRLELRGDELVVHPHIYSRTDRRSLAEQAVEKLAARGTPVDSAWLARRLEALEADGGRIPLAGLVAEAGGGVGMRAVVAAAER